MTAVVLPAGQNTVGVYKQIGLIILDQVNSRLVTLLKYIYATIHISNIHVFMFI
jgi:hypothetical protein